MNLYFRLLLILIKSKFAKWIGVLDTSRLWFRVWPFDCDVNFHLTNARYFSLCDLGRIYYLGQVGILFEMIKRKWLPVVQAQEISYFKPINPFQHIEVQTRFPWWDDKYWYAEHKFLSGDQVCAVLQVRGVIVNARKIIPMSDVVALTGQKVEMPDKPVNIEYWQKLIDTKKASQVS